jgi:hypothetical protein
MKAFVSAVIIFGTLAAATPAFAIQDKKADEAAKPEKRVCRSQQVTGSMMPKRECHTAAEWKQQDDSNAANVDQFRNRGSANGNPRGS